MLDQLLPQVQKLMTDQLKKKGPKAFVKVYSFLPIGVRLVVKEKTFVDFCMSHKDKILGKPAPAKKAKAASKPKASAKQTKGKKK
jgi:hypothetical protein